MNLYMANQQQPYYAPPMYPYPRDQFPPAPYYQQGPNAGTGATLVRTNATGRFDYQNAGFRIQESLFKTLSFQGVSSFPTTLNHALMVSYIFIKEIFYPPSGPARNFSAGAGGNKNSRPPQQNQFQREAPPAQRPQGPWGAPGASAPPRSVLIA